jgi:hypothetical protein
VEIPVVVSLHRNPNLFGDESNVLWRAGVATLRHGCEIAQLQQRQEAGCGDTQAADKNIVAVPVQVESYIIDRQFAAQG